MKTYVKIIKKFHLPLLAIALVFLVYFGVNGVQAQFEEKKEKTSQETKLNNKDLKIVAIDEGQNLRTEELKNGRTETTNEQKTTTQITNPTPEVKNIPAPAAETKTQRVNMKINAGRNAGNYVVGYKENESAFELLLRVAEVDYDMYPKWGAFVKAIGGLYNKGDCAWFFYVNGISWPEGSSLYIVKPNDIISWRYHEYWIY